MILLRGYAETSRMWRPIIPVLAKHFRVIAPDLPGIGDSGIPADGLDTFQKAARDFALLAETKLTMPVLAIGGEKANGEETTDALLQFLGR